MKILIDVKNLALYSGGIAHWIRPLIAKWVEMENGHNQFIALYPVGDNLKIVDLKSAIPERLRWPRIIPRKLCHIWYDNIQFPCAAKRIKPQFIFSPYHDVRLPKKSTSCYSVISVLDLCFIDVPKSYPFFVRFYYVWMLRVNISRAHHILTISEATKSRLLERFNLPNQLISVIPNALEAEFLDYLPTHLDIEHWRNKYALTDCKIALYSSGIEYRKNIERMLAAFRLLWREGHEISLCITGRIDPRWRYLFLDNEISSGKIKFLGFLSLSDLRLAYAAADCVVFPSLCEGFGRACIEAMVCGKPLACSDLPVFHEVAGNYPVYFNPLDVMGMAKTITLALNRGPQIPCESSSYRFEVVQNQFIGVMDSLVKEADALALKSK